MLTTSGVGLRHRADGSVEIAPTQGGNTSRHLGQEHATKLTRAERRSRLRRIPLRVSGLIERSHRCERDRDEKHRGAAHRQCALSDLVSDSSDEDRG